MTSPISNVTNQVLNAIHEDPRTKGENIDATVHQGVLTLTGSVKTNEVRDAAEQIARKLPGVITVINDIKVK